MGIKTINQTFKKRAPSAFTTLPLLTFHGYRLAFDGCNWAYQYRAGIFKNYVYAQPDPLEEVDVAKILDTLVAKFFDFNCQMMEIGITPVWAWDGEPYPEKDAEKEKRGDSKISEGQKLKDLANELRSMHPLQRTPDVLKEYRKKKANSGYPTSAEIDLLKHVAACAGLPSLQATHDGENLCAQLCREGFCKATWSNDTDAYPLGNTILILGFEKGDRNEPVFEATLVYKFSELLELTQDQVRDVCILSGCDYNTNISGIGPGRAIDRIKKYGSIEGMIKAEPNHDYNVLNYERCREIFATPPLDFKDNDPNLQFNYERLTEFGRDLFHQHNIDQYFNRFVNATRILPKMPKRVDVKALTTPIIVNTGVTQLIIDDDVTPIVANKDIELITQYLQQSNIQFSQGLPSLTRHVPQLSTSMTQLVIE
jgi:flap endonuclease-1